MAQNIKFHTVTFLPENKVIQVEDRKTIFETILEHNPHGIDLHYACGAEGICRKCKVRAFQQMGPVTPTERGCLSQEELAKGIRLSCQARVIQNTTVEILYKLPFTIQLTDEPAVPENMILAPSCELAFAVVANIGVNTIVLSLIDCRRGRKIAVVTDTNPQIEIGADFDLRVAMVEENELNLEILNEELLLRIDILIEELCRAASVASEQVGDIVLSGETGMLHLFLKGIWNPMLQASRPDGMYQAQQFDLKSSPGARIHALPVISSYAGADTTAAIIATRLHKSTATTVLLDLGTNTRAVLYHQGVLTAASVSGCGVFDCVDVSCGMRPETGAIDHVFFDGKVFSVSVIGESLPRGICGSGLLACAAALKQAGFVNSQGEFRNEVVFNHPMYGLIDSDGGAAFRLYADEGIFNTDLCITRDDIRSLLQAKAKVNMLMRNLIEAAGISFAEIEAVIVSGSIGNLSKSTALIELGFLATVFSDRITYVENAAKKGGQLVLFDSAILAEAEVLARSVICLPEITGPVQDDDLHFEQPKE